MTVVFQSTPSAWRETWHTLLLEVFIRFQSTPSAWRETKDGIIVERKEEISIHSLRMEGDERTMEEVAVTSISIHSLRMEGDRPP